MAIIRPGFRSSPSFSMVLAATMLVLGLIYARAAEEGACEGDVQGLITKCAAYVQKGAAVADPSEACCEAVKTVDIPCICTKITKDIEIIVDMNKVFHLASFCGRPLAHGTKCGSSIVP